MEYYISVNVIETVKMRSVSKGEAPPVVTSQVVSE